MSAVSKSVEQAVRYHQCGDIHRAQRLYQQVLHSEPNNPVALHSLGLIAYQEKRYEEAIDFVKKAIEGNPNVAQFHNTLGVILEALGRYQEAQGAYERAVSLKIDYAEPYHNMAILYQSQGSYSEALEKCRQTIRIKNDYAEAYNTQGYCLEKLGQTDEAMESYRQAVQYRPDYAEAYNHIGVLLNAGGRSSEAIENFRKALELEPDYAEVYNNLGVALKELERWDEAEGNYRRAIGLEPDFEEVYYNLANLLRDKGNCDEAIGNYRRATQLKPDYAEAHWNMALALLLNGEFIEGWQKYKWRRNADLKLITDLHTYGKPRWDGASFAGKRLLVHYEQGLGDNIQFARYLPMVKERGGTVIFETLSPLMGLFEGFKGVDELVEYSPEGKRDVEFDIYASLLDMPMIFKTTAEAVPAKVPYIRADMNKVVYWLNKLTGTAFKVGIVWAGSPTHGYDKYRSCRVEDFVPLSKIGGVRLYGLQKGEAAGQMDGLAGLMEVVKISREIEDFTDTAAVIENLDLVISVDTSVLHLAGAMGKPTWALLAFTPEWRWMLDRDDSPWYPTMRLFRQRRLGRWDEVFSRMAQELQKLVDSRMY